MSKNPWQTDVEDFMTVAGQEVRSTPDATFPVHFEALVELHGAHAALHVLAERLKVKGHQGTSALRARLMIEEVGETVKGLASEDAVEIADGLADLLYVTIGTAAAYGIDLAPVWDAVHGANMAKFPVCPECGGKGHGPGGREAAGVTVNEDLTWTGPVCTTCKGKGRVVIRDAGGKVQKPAGWAPADIGAVLKAQGWKGRAQGWKGGDRG